MQGWQRYAIYHLPGNGPLADFGAAWLGWDCIAGREVAHPDLPVLPRPVAELTATPRRYGFHGTLKAPFRLAAGQSQAGLHGALCALAASLAPVTAGALHLTATRGFLALVPDGRTEALDAAAARIVTALDHFRAPPPEAELAARRGNGLTARQDAHLLAWGYPYVMEEFHFHMTLTGRLPAPEAEAVHAALAPRLAPLLQASFCMDDICLAGQDAAGRFHLIHRYDLSG